MYLDDCEHFFYSHDASYNFFFFFKKASDILPIYLQNRKQFFQFLEIANLIAVRLGKPDFFLFFLRKVSLKP